MSMLLDGHDCARGQLVHAGDLAVQIVAPRSITAWCHSAALRAGMNDSANGMSVLSVSVSAVVR